jgi:hypothetical protein
MARLRRYSAVALILFGWVASTPAGAQGLPPGFYDRPVLVVDPGRHTAPIIRADVDAAGRFAVTASRDKTARVWSLATGAWSAPSACPPAPELWARPMRSPSTRQGR